QRDDRPGISRAEIDRADDEGSDDSHGISAITGWPGGWIDRATVVSVVKTTAKRRQRAAAASRLEATDEQSPEYDGPRCPETVPKGMRGFFLMGRVSARLLRPAPAVGFGLIGINVHGGARLHRAVAGGRPCPDTSGGHGALDKGRDYAQRFPPKRHSARK